MGRKATRRPGRPVEGDTDQRQKLLDTACQALAGSGVEGLTLREVASAAGVSASLANYYFVDRDGLIEAVQSERLLPLTQALCNAVRERPGDAGGGIAAFIQLFHGAAARNPWFARLLFLHSPRSDALTPVLTLLTALVTAAQQSGTIRRDLRVEGIVMSLLSLCAFAFVARDQLADTLGIDLGPGAAAALTLHQMAILRGGLQSPRQDSRS